MKPTKQKHGKENTIGKIIYGFLLFMPLLAIAVTCAYVIFNKNAYQSYYGETINEVSINDLSSNNDIDSDIDYYYQSSKVFDTEYSGTILYTSCEYINSTNTFSNETITFINNSTRLYFFRGTSTTFYLSDNTSLVVTGNLEVKLSDINSIGSGASAYRSLYYKTYNNLSYLSEVFYCGVNEVKQSPLFNWSYNTATYNVLESTCNTLGITNNFVPMMLSYWIMMSLMYLLYDIALLIVHMAHNRIHDIESSI